MDATVAVSIAGLITTGGTAGWLRWLDDRRHARQLAHERALADRDELRPLLDEAAGLTRRAMWVVGEVAAALRGVRVEVPQALAQMTSLSTEAALMVGRLALRLGHDHEVTKAYDETVNIYHRMLIESKSALPDGGFVGCGARREAATRMEAVPDEFEAEFVAARRKFIAAAQRVVGADLGALA